MEDYSGSGLLVNGSSSSCADGSEIPVGTKAFAPFILLELLVAFASNIILTALIIKAQRVQNNTNIYLFSLSIAGLMEGLVLFVLLVTVIAGKWVLGRDLCIINQFLMYILLVLILLTHLATSRDRYTTVRDPINWQSRVKQALITTAAVGDSHWYLHYFDWQLGSTFCSNHVFRLWRAISSASGSGLRGVQMKTTLYQSCISYRLWFSQVQCP